MSEVYRCMVGVIVVGVLVLAEESEPTGRSSVSDSEAPQLSVARRIT